jgi:hypothetical protein
VKKLVLVVALLLIIPVMLVGCSTNESAGVKSSINGFVDAYNNEDYEKCTDYLLGITDATKDTVKATLKLARELGGEVEVTSIEDINVDGDSATAKVTVKVQGQSQTNTATLNKVDGKWKFSLGDLLSTGG